jgi:hypothetical protein
MSENETTQMVKRNSIKELSENIQTIVSDQDFKQKSAVYVSFVLELYRVLMGSMLLMFVPQKCDDHICDMFENTIVVPEVYTTAIALNAYSLICFLIMYVVEIKRENKLITYLEVDKHLAFDNESIGEALVKLPTNKKDAILAYDSYYLHSGYLALTAFVLNAGVSGYVVFTNYLDDKTFTVYLTNILFMALKVKETYDIVNTKKNIFYSAYLTDRIQFNAVDKDKMIETVEEESSLNTLESQSSDVKIEVDDESD